MTLDLVPKHVASRPAEALTAALPEFRWSLGEDDLQGECLAGTSDAGVNLKVWLRDQPLTASISYYGAWRREPDRESRKMESIATIQKKLLGEFEVVRVVM